MFAYCWERFAGAGYVSHSFSQFVKTDGRYLYRLDHGDAYPRAVVITKADVDFSVSYEDNWYPGTASVILEGMGLFEGKAVKKFQIDGDDGAGTAVGTTTSGGTKTDYITSLSALTGKKK